MKFSYLTNCVELGQADVPDLNTMIAIGRDVSYSLSQSAATGSRGHARWITKWVPVTVCTSKTIGTSTTTAAPFVASLVTTPNTAPSSTSSLCSR